MTKRPPLNKKPFFPPPELSSQPPSLDACHGSCVNSDGSSIATDVGAAELDRNETSSQQFRQLRLTAYEDDHVLGDFVTRINGFPSLRRTETSIIRPVIKRVDHAFQSPSGEEKQLQIASYLPSEPDIITAFPARDRLPGEQRPWHSQTGRQTTQPPRPNGRQTTQRLRPKRKSKSTSHGQDAENTTTEGTRPSLEPNIRSPSTPEHQQSFATSSHNTSLQFGSSLTQASHSPTPPPQDQSTAVDTFPEFQAPDLLHAPFVYNAAGPSMYDTASAPNSMHLPAQSSTTHLQEPSPTTLDDRTIPSQSSIDEHQSASSTREKYMTRVPSLNFSSSSGSGASPYESPPPQTPTPSTAPDWPAGSSPTAYLPDSSIETQKDTFNFSDYLEFDGGG